MNQLLIKISKTLYDKSEVLVNGQKEKFADNKRGSYELSVPAENNVEIQITRRHELATPLWWLWGLLFFVISCFGIFDVPYAKQGELFFKANVTSSGSGAVQLNPVVKRNGKGVIVVCDNCFVYEEDNRTDDKTVKKRRKVLTVIKLLLWLALIAAVVVAVIM